MSRIKRNELEGALDETSWTKAHGLEAIGPAKYLATFDNYPLTRNNSSFGVGDCENRTAHSHNRHHELSLGEEG